jgi:transcriptional regulator with XRE-family HTH domain
MAQQHFAARRVNLVGARIRQLRKARNLTQTELSERIGIQQSDLSRMEKGEYKVGLDTLFKVLGVFQLDMASFFEESKAGAASEAEGAWRDFLSLDEDSRREVHDFIRFKMRKGPDPEPQDED